MILGVDNPSQGVTVSVPVAIAASAEASLALEPNNADVAVTGLGFTLAR